jgi:hypothetical protein
MKPTQEINLNITKIQLQTADIMSEKIDLLNTNTTQIDPLPILSKRVVLNNSEPTNNLYRDKS